jgi:outer membrane protein assembly factor BamB
MGVKHLADNQFGGRTMKFFKSMTIAVCALVFLATVLNAQDSWPEFRGPTGDGMATSADLPEGFSEEENVAWKTAIHGKGWSSPVISDGKVWMTTATEDGTQMSVVGVEVETGAIVFDQVVFENERPDFCHEMNSYATPTPVASEGKVFVHFGKYGTACLDAESGKKIWERRDFECNHFRGPGSSPILFEDRLFVAFDGFDVQYVVAISTESGETIWKTDRDIEYSTDNGDWKKAYCTGTIARVDGHPVLIYPSAGSTEAFDPMSGKRKWVVKHGGMNASARPLVDEHGVAIIANGMGQMVGVKIGGEGDVTESHLQWTMSKGASKRASQLMVDGLLLMMSDRGILSCLVPGADELLYRQRLKGTFAASPIHANGLVYLPSIEGKVYVIRSGPDFELVSECKLGDGFMASPAVVGNKLILRSRSHLYCIERSKN